SGHGKLTREMTRLMASFAHRASIGFQYIGQRPLFNSLFIYGAGTENSAGVDDPAETTNNVRVGTSIQLFVHSWLTSVTGPEFVNCDDKTKVCTFIGNYRFDNYKTHKQK
ncbi:hypothetical protein Tco_0044227, partial [Tanacetum coccineum]